MNFFTELAQATKKEREALFNIPQIQAAAKGQSTLEAHISFLTESYHLATHIVPLMMKCGSRLPQAPVWLREALYEHLEEEKGHEEWLLNDISNCGADAEAVRNSQPGTQTEALIAYAYYAIDHINPLSLFSLLLVLQGSNVEAAIKSANSIHNNPNLAQAARTFLASKGDLDLTRLSFFECSMNNIESTQDQAAIIHSAKVMYSLYGNIFHDLPKVASPKQQNLYLVAKTPQEAANLMRAANQSTIA